MIWGTFDVSLRVQSCGLGRIEENSRGLQAWDLFMNRVDVPARTGFRAEAT